MSERPAASNLPERGEPGGGALHPVLRCLLYVVFWWAVTAVLLGIAALYVGPIYRSDGRLDQSASLFVAVTCECVAAVGVALLFRRFVDRRPPGSLGLTFHVRWLRLFGIGALLGFGMQTIVLILESALGFAHAATPHWPGTEIESLAYVIPLLILAAIAEEMPIRGYLFQNLKQAWGAWPALIATSLVFAALHLFNPGAHSDIGLTIAGIAAAGALFCLSVMLTGSLWLALGCHFAWNLFEGPIFGFPVSGQTFGSANIFAQSVTGPEWFTGGSFGPEAGASSLIALAVGAAALYALQRFGIFDA
jgi:membrane protease YdiL (CAAX protease family)